MKHCFAVAVCLCAASSLMAADAGLLALASPSTKTVAGIHVDRTAGSPFGRFLLSQMDENDTNFREFVAATGFDPRRDLREVILVSEEGPGAKTGRGLILARGTFNSAQIALTAKTHGATTESYGGVDLIKSKGTHAFAILSSGIALAGDEASVKAAIDRQKTPSTLPATLAAKVTDVSGRFDAWMVSTAPLSQFAGAAPTKQVRGVMQSEALQSIEQTSGGVRFGNLIELYGEAIAANAKDAQALADVVRFIAGMAQMSRDRSPEASKLASLLDTLQVRANETAVQLTLSVPQADLEEFMKRRPSRQAAAGK